MNWNFCLTYLFCRLVAFIDGWLFEFFFVVSCSSCETDGFGNIELLNKHMNRTRCLLCVWVGVAKKMLSEPRLLIENCPKIYICRTALTHSIYITPLNSCMFQFWWSHWCTTLAGNVSECVPCVCMNVCAPCACVFMVVLSHLSLYARGCVYLCTILCECVSIHVTRIYVILTVATCRWNIKHACIILCCDGV